MQGSNCCFLTCIQVSHETGKMVWYSRLFKSFEICYDSHSQRLLCSQWNWSRCFSKIPLLSLIQRMLAVCSLLPLPKPSLYIWNFSIQVLLKPLKDFEHHLTSMGSERNGTEVWTFISAALLWNWDENWLFPILWPLLGFPNLLTYGVQNFNTIIFLYFKYLSWNSITSTNLIGSKAT